MSYATTPYDTRPGAGVGSYSGDSVSQRGKTRAIFIPLDEKEQEIDDFVDSLLSSETEDAIHSKINTYYHGGIDAYQPRGDKQYYVGGNIVAEFSGHHRNPVRHGISPYKQPKHSGPPLGTGSASQAFRTTGNYRRTGTQYGSSRPHKILSDIEDENIVSLDSILNPLERSFRRHNNRVKKILNLLKENLL